jgi:prepilin-type N-terminal cleavage/methylation domain-containing protein
MTPTGLGSCLNLDRMGKPVQDERGFSLVEIVVTLAVFAVLGGLAIGVTNSVVSASRAESAAQRLEAFLKRHREMAVARRRDIEIRFTAPDRVESFVRAIPNPPNPTPAPAPLETLRFEGGMRYLLMEGVPDTPNLFGNDRAVFVGGANPVMFASEGAFIDANNNPINATISLGIEGIPLSASAVTILGPTASVERWRWNGNAWTK